MKLRPLVADLLLLTVTLIWGTTFVIVKSALALSGPHYFLAIRFGLAALALLPLILRGRPGRRRLLSGRVGADDPGSLTLGIAR